MRRLRLTGTVEITGKDFWGRKSTLVVSPLTDQTNYSWIWDVGKGIPITPKLFEVGGFLGRCVTLVHGKRIFHEFEHALAFLHALGVRGVRVRLEHSTWPPFMCQVELRQRIRPLLIPQTPLKPYMPPAQQLTAKSGIARAASYTPNRTQDLLIKSYVNYGGERTGSHELAFCSGVDEGDLMDVLSARTLGKPQLLQPIAWAAAKLERWRGQSKNVLWKPWFKEPGPLFYKELAKHKIVDASLYSFGAPSNSFLAGTIELFCADHALDLRTVKELYPHDNVAAFRKAV